MKNSRTEHKTESSVFGGGWTHLHKSRMTIHRISLFIKNLSESSSSLASEDGVETNIHRYHMPWGGGALPISWYTQTYRWNGASFLPSVISIMVRKFCMPLYQWVVNLSPGIIYTVMKYNFIMNGSGFST